ncbi:MAG: glycine cleavage system aminomethyltransferase GcvT, partial [Pseudomonadota bacterium]
MSAESQKTPLYQIHVDSGGKMVDFAGWQMPVQFQGIRQEHMHVREKIGLFDVSHMGEIRVRGRESLKSLQWLTTNDVSKLKKGQAQYTLIPNETGGIVDDMIVYCMEPGEDYLLCVNAANIAKDFKHLTENNRGAIIENESDQWAQIAIQGPQAIETISKVIETDFSECPSFEFREWTYEGQTCYVARTGYTGEDGAEIFVPNDLAASLWKAFIAANEEVWPIGLGARDTLRTEMKYPLYGQDIDDQSIPYEAGLGWVVKPDKGDFIGKSEMLAVKDKGVERKLVGLEIQGPGIARAGYKVFSVDSE